MTPRPKPAKAKTVRRYIEAQYRRFVRLVEKGESRVQMHRIESRLDWRKFIEEVGGKDVCDEMFARLTRKASR